MKKYIAIMLSILLAVSLCGCAKGVESCPAAEGTPGAGVSDEAGDSNQNIISSDQLGQGVYVTLTEEWAKWDAKDEMQKMLSSHMPGHCYLGFDTWAECEEFLGFEIFNPLEDSEFEKGTYVGMPEGYADAARFYVSLYGPSAEQAQWIFVDSGYRDGDVRITVNAQIFVDTPKENLDNQEPLITEDSGEKYVATTALLARGPVTYSIRVIGEQNQWDAVRETLDKVLPYFTNNSAEK